MVTQISGNSPKTKRGSGPLHVMFKLRFATKMNLFYLLNHCLESFRVVHGQVSQYFPVQVNS